MTENPSRHHITEEEADRERLIYFADQNIHGVGVIYGFRNELAWWLHAWLCRDYGKDLMPTDSEYEADTDLTVREFLKRSVLETDAELLAV